MQALLIARVALHNQMANIPRVLSLLAAGDVTIPIRFGAAARCMLHCTKCCVLHGSLFRHHDHAVLSYYLGCSAQGDYNVTCFLIFWKLRRTEYCAVHRTARVMVGVRPLPGSVGCACARGRLTFSFRNARAHMGDSPPHFRTHVHTWVTHPYISERTCTRGLQALIIRHKGPVAQTLMVEQAKVSADLHVCFGQIAYS